MINKKLEYNTELMLITMDFWMSIWSGWRWRYRFNLWWIAGPTWIKASRNESDGKNSTRRKRECARRYSAEFKRLRPRSGFGKKTYFDEEIFIGASYGDYFIKLLINARNKGVKCREVGYICTPRLYGVSKTGTNYFQLFKRGLPYIKTIFSLKGKKWKKY